MCFYLGLNVYHLFILYKYAKVQNEVRNTSFDACFKINQLIAAHIAALLLPPDQLLLVCEAGGSRSSGERSEGLRVYGEISLGESVSEAARLCTRG